MSLDCLDKIVGLSATACTCWDSTKPVDFNTLNQSTSGLYVSQPDTIPIRWTNSAADCENGGIWSLIQQARDKAVRDLLSDYLAETKRVKQEQFLPFTKIGDDYYKAAETVHDTTAAVWLEPYEIRGAKLRIDSIDIAFWDGILAPTNVDISIYSSLNLSTPIDTATATVNGNKEYFTATFASPVIIDLGNIREDLNERIYFVYTIPAGARPVKNNIEKGCQCNNRNKYRENPFLQILCAGGTQSDSVLNLGSNMYGSATMNGLVLNASMECDYYSWLCDLAQKPNDSTLIGGQRLALGMALADGIQAKAIFNLAASILMSGRINHYTMVLDPKQLYQIQNHYIKIYRMAIKNLVYYMPADVSDCLVCGTDKRMVKNQILV
jgi:hypothetical protein